MVGFPSPFGGDDASEGTFDPADRFNPGHIPSPGQFLAGHDVLTDEAHVQFHQLSEELFERRGVYDITFGYNLARLNLDRRHPDAGFRYAEEADDSSVLRAEFTPTTPFCPQSDTLTRAAFRTWNGMRDEHEYDLVRIRVAEMHHGSDDINAALADLDASVGTDQGDDTRAQNTGPPARDAEQAARSDGPGCGSGMGRPSRGGGPDAPL